MEVRRHIPSRKIRRKRLFNLDLHVSVIKDVKEGLGSLDVDVESWSISRHNHVFNRFFKYPDPVKYINARTWPDIDENSIENFQKYYAKYLRQFDGFVVTHTPVFHEIFKSLGKPILILNTTRYESPFTIDSQKWKNLDNSLAQAVREGQTLIYSNNRGDAKYLQHFTGIATDVIPSVCDYVKKSWVGTRRVKIFFDNRQPDYLRSKLSSLVNWKRSTEVLGSQFLWDDLIEVSCVFIVPYNVSTMQLFELSTAGIPVVVPSKRFLAELFSLDCALGEISFYQINQIPIDSLGSDNPNNFASPEFLNFWIESADFYNRDLMQNVFYVDSFEELDDFNPPKLTESLSKQQIDRNTFYSEMRQKALLNFIEKL